MPRTSRMEWPYPSENKDPWYGAFVEFLTSLDASGFAARDDRNLMLSGGGTISWDATTATLTWTDTIAVTCPITGFQNRLLAGSVTVVDGEVLYLNLTRAPTQNVNLSANVAPQVPSSDRDYVLCIRVGTSLLWRNGLLMDSGDSVSGLGSGQGGGGGKEMDWVDTYQYTQAASPFEETVSYGYFDASTVSGTIYFWALMTPTFGTPGTAELRLYDVGPAAGPPTAPVLVATLSSATSGGPQSLQQALAVAAAPGVNQIANSARMYEVRAYQSSAAGDTIFVGCGGMADR